MDFTKTEVRITAQKIIRRGFRSYEIFAGQDSGKEIDAIEFSGRSSVRAFLNGFIDNYLNLSNMRLSLGGSHLQPNLNRLSNAEILDQLAWRIASKQILIRELPYEPPTWNPISLTAFEASDEAKIAPTMEPEKEKEIELKPFLEENEQVFLKPFIEDEVPFGLEPFVEMEEPLALEPSIK